MGMKPLDTKEACGILNEIMEYELAGVGSLHSLGNDGNWAL
jgi:hypothetical protein